MSKIFAIIVLTFSLIYLIESTPEIVTKHEEGFNTRLYGKQIKAFIEDVRQRLCHEIEELDLPKLDPFELDKFELELDNDLGQIEGTIRNFAFSGLSKLEVNFADIKLGLPTQFILNITEPKLNLNAKTKIKGTLGGTFPIDQDGDVSVEIQGLNVGAVLDLDLKLTRIEFQILKASVDLSIDGLVVNIENLTPDEEVNDFFNQALSDLGPEIVENLWGRFKSDIDEMIKELAIERMGGLMEYIVGDKKLPVIEPGKEC